MNNTKLPVSLEDTTELRKLIMENPDLPLLFFVGDDAYHDEGYQYSMAYASNAEIQKLTLYSDVWMDKDDYAEKLRDDLAFEEEYINMTDDEYDEMIDQKVRETEFVKSNRNLCRINRRMIGFMVGRKCLDYFIARSVTRNKY